jgi:hypothetical protein
MPDRPFLLHFDSSQAPALLAAFQTAYDKLDIAIAAVNRDGWLPEPWLGDPSSERIATHFNQIAVTDEMSGTNVFRLFQKELQHIIDQLQATAAAYSATEQSTITSFRDAPG